MSIQTSQFFGFNYALDINTAGSVTAFYIGDNGEVINGAQFCASQGMLFGGVN